MNINLKKTVGQLERSLPAGGEADLSRLRRMYDLTLRLQSQVLSVIYDIEIFGGAEKPERIADAHGTGRNADGVVTLMIREPLPSMKRLTEAVEEHWKAMIHAAIREAGEQGPLPWFERAMVGIEIVTPRGSGNARLWDTSNRAVNVVINNLKGIFFADDNLEHMAFSVVGRWGEEGVTTVRIWDFDRPKVPAP